MAKLLKIPADTRHEFLRRLYSTGLSDQNIDIVIDDMWYRFEVGEFTDKLHSEVRKALAVSNPLSAKCQKKWKDYWENLPTLGILASSDKTEVLRQRCEWLVSKQIHVIESMLNNAKETDGTDPVVTQHIVALLGALHKVNTLALSVIDGQSAMQDAQGDTASDNSDMQRLLALIGADDSPLDYNSRMTDTNGGAHGKI